MKTLARLGFLIAFAVMAAALLPGTSAAAGDTAITTVVSGLDNPRDLTFAPGGRLYVAEAGHGGSACTAGGPGGTLCAGFTSGISLVDLAQGTSSRVVTGVASTSGAGGFGATGVDGVSALGNGRLFGIVAGSSDAVPPGVFSPTLTAGLKDQLGRLIQTTRGGNWRSVADVGHTDFAWTTTHQSLVPDQYPDANPYGVLATQGGEWVVDAASNTLDRVRANGGVDVVAWLPSPAISDAVPTCIDRGPDGALYIGELTGDGNGPGSSVVWRYAPGSGLTQWATGLTAVTGCGFGADGAFYAVEFSTLGLGDAVPGTGAVVRVPAHSTVPVTIAQHLSFPGGFAAGRDGSLYFSDWSIAPSSTGLGSVDRLTLG
jgi:hypothetical protein